MPDYPDLIFWASNSMPHHILDRAEAVAPGGYASMSAMVGDLAAWERSGRPLAELRRELDAREVRVSTIDPYLSWYPGFDVDRPTPVLAPHWHHCGMTEEQLFRWADALGVEYVTVLGSFDGPPAPFDAVMDALGGFVDRAAEHGLRPHLEQIPSTKIHDLDDLLRWAEVIDRPNLGLLLDTYNLGRAGVAPEQLEAVPLERVFQLQLADGVGLEDGQDYFDDAFTRRSLPGHGSFPAAEMIAVLARKGPLPPSGPEVLYPELNALHPRDAGILAGTVTRTFLDRVYELAAPVGSASPNA